MKGRERGEEDRERRRGLVEEKRRGRGKEEREIRGGEGEM